MSFPALLREIPNLSLILKCRPNSHLMRLSATLTTLSCCDITLTVGVLFSAFAYALLHMLLSSWSELVGAPFSKRKTLQLSVPPSPLRTFVNCQGLPHGSNCSGKEIREGVAWHLSRLLSCAEASRLAVFSPCTPRKRRKLQATRLPNSNGCSRSLPCAIPRYLPRPLKRPVRGAPCQSACAMAWHCRGPPQPSIFRFLLL